MAFDPTSGSTIGRNLYLKGFMDALTEITLTFGDGNGKEKTREKIIELLDKVKRETDSLKEATEQLANGVTDTI